MNIDIFQILKLACHLVEDTELKNNPTFQIVKEVVNSVNTAPANSELKTQDSELHRGTR